MSKFNLDLKKFKKISTDRSKTILEHEDGHQLHLTHKSLSKPMLNELKGLPFSGEDNEDQLTKNYADGTKSGPVASDDSAPISINTDPNAATMPSAMITNPNATDDNLPYGVTTKDMANDPRAPNSPTTSSADASPTPQPQSPSTQDDATANSQVQVPNQGEMASNLLGSFGEESNAMTGLAQSEGKLGKQNATTEANFTKNLIDTQQTLKANQDKIMGEAMKVTQELQDPNSGISPNHLLDNMSTGKKISSAIGLILGGIGGGLTGQENPALKFLNNQIDRDIDAQKSNLNKKQNLFGAYLKEYGNVTDATQQAQITMLTQTAHQLQANADKMADPMAKQRAQAAIAELYRNQIQPKVQEFAMRQTMMNMASKPGANSDAALSYLDQVNPAYSKELRSRLIGNELANAPIDAKTKQSIVEKTNLVDNIRDLRQFASEHSGSLNPATIAAGKAKANIVLNQLRTATDQGVIKPSEIEFDRQLVDSDPTKFLGNFRTDPKYAEVERWGTQELNSTRNSLGLKPYSSIPEQSQQPIIKTMGGKPYQKIGNAWHPVKQ